MADNEAPKQPEPAPAAPPPLAPELTATNPGQTEPPADVAAIAQRMSRMQNKLLMDMSALTADITVIKQALGTIGNQIVPEGFEKLHTTFAMLARNVATSQVKADEGHLETRRLFSEGLGGLTQGVSGVLLEHVVEYFVLNALATIIDDTESVLGAATTDDRSLPAYEALRMLRTKLLASLERFGVGLIHIELGKSTFDGRLHEIASVTPTSDAPENTIVDLDKHGFFVNGRVARKATVVVATAKGAG